MSRAQKKAKDTDRRKGAKSGSHHEERSARKAQPRSQDENDENTEQLSLGGAERRSREDRPREEQSRDDGSQDERSRDERAQDEIETLPLMPPVQRGEESHAHRTAAADTRDGGRPEERSSAKSTRNVSDRDATGGVRGEHRPKGNGDAADTGEPASPALRGYRKGRDASEQTAESGSDGSRGASSDRGRDRGDVSPP